MTRQELLDQFISNLKTDNTKISYRGSLESFFSKYDFDIKDYKLEHLIRHKNYLTNNKSSSTALAALSAIVSFFKWCCSCGALENTPTQGLIKPDAVVEKSTKYFTDEEVKEIIDLPDKLSRYGRRHRLILILLAYLGLRRSELVNIKIKDIYEDRGVKVLRIVGKGNKVRILPLSEFLIKQIDSHVFKEISETKKVIKDEYYLLSLKDKPMHSDSIYKIVNHYASLIGLKGMSPHSFRATVISHLLEKGTSLRNVADFAGHSDVKTTINSYDKKRRGIKDSPALNINFGEDDDVA